MEQMRIIIYSIILGIVLGIIYDIIRIIRMLINPKNLGIFVQDVIYFLLSGLVTFLFVLMFNFGESRFYILAGEVVGWCAYHISIGELIYCRLKKYCAKHTFNKASKGSKK